MADVDECRVCGIGFRPEDDIVEVDDQRLHAACAEAPAKPKRRKLGAWASFGSRNQMELSEPQKG